MGIRYSAMNVLVDRPPCLIVNKPGGLLVQSPPGIDSLVDQVRRGLQCDAQEGAEQTAYLGIPHRLDRPVSGAILFARTPRAARQLSEQFAGRMINKEYWALVDGDVRPSRGTWRDRLRKLPHRSRAEVVQNGHPEGKLAVLHYCVEGRGSFGSWLRIRLETGRMHQIRVQSAARGHPILGDARYGSSRPFGPQTIDRRQRSIALHAQRLGFRHPVTREKIYAEAPLPPPWWQIGDRFD